MPKKGTERKKGEEDGERKDKGREDQCKTHIVRQRVKTKTSKMVIYTEQFSQQIVFNSLFNPHLHLVKTPHWIQLLLLSLRAVFMWAGNYSSDQLTLRT